jgi:hypothetical protein
MELDESFEEESGSTLRQKLESTLKENQELTSELSGLKAKELISEQGYGLVKPDDLMGVSLSEMAERAEALQGERQAMQADLAKDMLAKRGLEGDELERAVNDFLAPEAQDTAAHSRAREVAAVGGVSTPANNTQNLMGLDAIDAALRGTG